MSAFLPPLALPSRSLLQSRPSLSASLRSAPVCTASPPKPATMAQPDIKRMEPGPHYNHIVIHDNVVYLAGQVARGTDGTPYNETRGILEKIDALLAKAGTSKSRILFATVYMADIKGAAEMNRAWDEWVDKDNIPARATVQAQMVDPALGIEIQLTAALPPAGRVIETSKAAAAVGPYNQGIVVDNGTMYISGCIGLKLEGGIVSGGVEAETRQALSNLKAILENAGAGVGNIVKTTVLLADMADFGTVNGIYESFFEGGRVPARSCFAAKQLPKGALVEIEAIATLPRV